MSFPRGAVLTVTSELSFTMLQGMAFSRQQQRVWREIRSTVLCAEPGQKGNESSLLIIK